MEQNPQNQNQKHAHMAELSTKKSYELTKQQKKKKKVPIIKVGDIGYELFCTGVGRNHWTNFVVTKIKNASGKRIEIQFDNSITPTTLDWRSPGSWIPHNKRANDYRFHYIRFGANPNGETGAEQGMF